MHRTTAPEVLLIRADEVARNGALGRINFGQRFSRASCCKNTQNGNPLAEMATAVITAFLKAKMRNAKTSVALYTISSDLDGAKIVKQMEARFNRAIAGMLSTAPEPLTKDVQLVASMLQGAMAGISRRLLESGAPEKQFRAVAADLLSFV